MVLAKLVIWEFPAEKDLRHCSKKKLRLRNHPTSLSPPPSPALLSAHLAKTPHSVTLPPKVRPHSFFLFLPFSLLSPFRLLLFVFPSPSPLYQSIINPNPIKTAAAIHLTRNLAVELGPRHILCNSIAPGFIPSKMASGLIAKNGGEEALAAAHPNGRLGRPEDIAATVVFLASRASSHVNGACVVVDGGRRWAGGRL